MGISEELEKLQKLHQSGGLSDDEYAKAKAALLATQQGAPAPAATPAAPADVDAQTRQWAMFVHLSLLAGFIIPLVGWAAPIVIWQLKKKELPGIEVHGKNVTNWIISALIYGAVSGVLVLIVIGILGLIALSICTIVFAIMGGLKANKGEVWKYPLTITFIK